jgi:hypothetical protein
MSSLNDLVSLMREAKEKSPEHKIIKEVKENIQSDLSVLFEELASLQKHKEKLVEENPTLLEETPIPTPVGVTPTELQIPNIDKYLSTPAGIAAPVDPLTKQFKTVDAKIKFLEQWIAKIQNAGPGGGAGDVVNLDHPTTLVTTPSYTVGRKDYYIGVNYAGTVTLTLPSIVKNGRYLIIKDESGRCSKFPIIVHGNVDNDPNGFILKIDNGGIQMIYRDGWRIV